MEKTRTSQIGTVFAGAAALLAGGLAVWFLVPAEPKLVLKESAAAKAAEPTLGEMQQAVREEQRANAEHMRPAGNPHVSPALESEDQRLKTANTENFRRLDWRVLRGLDVKTGEITPQVRAFEGGSIKIPGFMVPFDDEEEKVSQFLLVPQAGMCIHTPAAAGQSTDSRGDVRRGEAGGLEPANHGLRHAGDCAIELAVRTGGLQSERHGGARRVAGRYGWVAPGKGRNGEARVTKRTKKASTAN